MKLVALIPYAGESRPDGFPERTLVQARKLTDSVIVLVNEHLSKTATWFTTYGMPLENMVDELVTIHNQDTSWKEWFARMTMMTRAAEHGADWVLWLDSDEVLEPATTRDILAGHIQKAEEAKALHIWCPFREIWNDKMQYRIDGCWGDKGKVFLQKNPFTTSLQGWEYRGQTYHTFLGKPETQSISVQTQLLHFNMTSPKLRQARFDRYKRIDPNHDWQPTGYDHMIDENGIVLADFKPAKL
jgi:hypothetical protein